MTEGMIDGWYESPPPPRLHLDKQDDKPCVHIFRYRENVYCTDNAFVNKQEWRLMKRLSCKEGHRQDGAPCWSPFEEASEGDPECVVIECSNPVDGKLYRAVYHADSPDWETGIVDGWWWDMVPYEEEKDG